MGIRFIQKRLTSEVLEGQRGFLLLETLMAVFFLAVGLTAVLHSYGSSIDGLGHSGDYTKALMLVEKSMWKFEAKGSISPGTYSGRFADGNEQFTWQVEAVEIEELGICETRATVSWHKRGKTRNVSVVTYLPRAA